MAPIVTGLDIGSDSVKLVQIRRGRGDSYKIISEGMMEIQTPAGGVDFSSPEKTPAAEAIKKLLGQMKIHPSHLVTAVSKQSVVVRYIKLPTNSISEVEQMIRFEAAKYVPFYTDEDIVDFELVSSSHLGGSEVLMAVCRRDAVEEQLNLLRALHLEPYAIDASSLALMRGLKVARAGAFKEPNKTFLMMDFGFTSMELFLVQNQALKYSRATPIGGSQLMRAFQRGLEVSEAESRQMLMKMDFSQPDYGLNGYDKETLRDTVSSWQERVDNEIKRSIDYFSNEFGISHIDSIVLSGGLSRIPTLKDYLEKELGIPIKPVSFVTTGRNGEGEPLPELNTAFGLALRAMDANRGEAVNLLPPEILRKRIQRKRQFFMGQVGIGVAALFVAAGVYGYQQYAGMQKQINTISRDLMMKKPKTEKLAEMQKQLESIRKMVSQTDVSVETLNGLSSCELIPGRVALEKVVYERNKVLTLTAVSMSMEDAVNFRFEVEKLGYFSLVEIENANTDKMENQQVVRFNVVCKVKPSKGDQSSGIDESKGEGE
jgi:type IV pilus assembly protein PilM